MSLSLLNDPESSPRIAKPLGTHPMSLDNPSNREKHDGLVRCERKAIRTRNKSRESPLRQEPIHSWHGCS